MRRSWEISRRNSRLPRKRRSVTAREIGRGSSIRLQRKEWGRRFRKWARQEVESYVLRSKIYWPSSVGPKTIASSSISLVMSNDLALFPTASFPSSLFLASVFTVQLSKRVIEVISTANPLYSTLHAKGTKYLKSGSFF